MIDPDLILKYSKRFFTDGALGLLPNVADFPQKASAPKEKNPAYTLPPGAKLNLSTKEVTTALGSPRLFQRLRHAKWIKPLYPSKDSLYPVSQVIAVQRRLEIGELPPLLPSEIKQRRKWIN